MLALISRIRRLRPQFSLRALLLFMLVCALPCGWYARAERQRKAVETAFEGGGGLYPLFLYDHECAPSGAIDLVRYCDTHKPSARYSNLFHRPIILLAGVGHCRGLPSRLTGLSDIEVFLLIQPVQHEQTEYIRWQSLGELTSLEQIYLGNGRVRVKDRRR